jgi:hypothetical protein
MAGFLPKYKLGLRKKTVRCGSFYPVHFTQVKKALNEYCQQLVKILKLDLSLEMKYSWAIKFFYIYIHL